MLCKARERDALLQFKAGITRDERGVLSSWDVLTEEDCCRWNGITCNNRTGHVIELLLKGNFLHRMVGRINPSLVELKHLRKLELDSIDFGFNPLPDFLDSFKKLAYLKLSDGNFSGIIPRQIGNLSALESLDFSGNDHLASDGQWLFNMSSLRYLDLSFVDLGNARSLFQALSKSPFISYIVLRNCQLDPRSLTSLEYANFSKLSSLDLSFNYMEFRIPQWLLTITSLRNLYMTKNVIKHIGDDIPGSLCNLQELILHECEIQDANIENFFTGCSNRRLGLVKLDLSWNSITGHLPMWLVDYKLLQHLDLRFNNLSGSIPPSVGGMHSLQFFGLSNNKFIGGIPESLWSLTSCQDIDLGYNDLNGSLPSSFGSAITSMQLLDLSNNKISGNIPESIGDMKLLTNLDLSHNRFSGNIPVSLGSLTSCKWMDLSYNNFSGSVPPSLGQLQLLESLTLAGNTLEGRLTDAHFQNLKNLSSLDLSETGFHLMLSPSWVPPFQLYYLSVAYCKVGPQFPWWLRSQTSLAYLNMSNSGISDVIPQWIWSFSPMMADMDLSMNNMTGIVPVARNNTSVEFTSIIFHSNRLKGFVSSFPAVKYLMISNNSLSGPIRLSKASSLHILSLSHNNLSGSIPSCLCEAPDLEVLDLSNNHLSGGLPSCLGSSSSLGSCSIVSMHLGNNSLQGFLPASLQNCKNMSVLDVGENRFSGPVPDWISSKMIGLIVLRLSSNSFHGNIPPHLSNLPLLQILDMSGNNLSGSIPPTFGNFKAMKNATLHNGPNNFYQGGYYKEGFSITSKGGKLEYKSSLELVVSMDLSRNALYGEIPPAIGNLNGLINLNMSSNALIGCIPGTLGNLGHLESLDLSRNHINGLIPPSLSNLTFLSVFDVSFNNLSGRIPIGTQLDSFPNSSYMGNPLLCGKPLEECKFNGPPNIMPNSKTSDDALLWFYIGVAFGFVMGFWTFCGILILKRSWRYAYYHFLDNLGERFHLITISSIHK